MTTTHRLASSLLLLLALAPACGGDDGLDYQGACEKFVECGVSEQSADECAADAEADVEGGEVSEADAEACIDCVLDTACEDLARCAAACDF